MKDKELAKLIEKWFADHSQDSNKWNRSAAGVAIQTGVRACGNWKNAKRGNPRKAHQAMRETLARQNGWEPPEENEGYWRFKNPEKNRKKRKNFKSFSCMFLALWYGFSSYENCKSSWNCRDCFARYGYARDGRALLPKDQTSLLSASGETFGRYG